MKKLGLFIATLLLVMLCIPTITACSCSRIIASGYYKLQTLTITTGGASQTYNLGDVSPLDSNPLTEDYAQLILQDDESGYFMLNGAETPLTWSQKKTNVTLNITGITSSVSSTLNGHTLTFSITENDTTVKYTLTRKNTIKFVGTYYYYSQTYYDASNNPTLIDSVEDDPTLKDSSKLIVKGDGSWEMYYYDTFEYKGFFVVTALGDLTIVVEGEDETLTYTGTIADDTITIVLEELDGRTETVLIKD